MSREFVGRTGEHVRALMARSLADVPLAALMLDGLELKGRCCVVALCVSTDLVKVPLGLWDGATENKRMRELLANLVDRGLSASTSSWTAARHCGPRRRRLRRRPGPALHPSQETLSSKNPIESMVGVSRATSRNVER